MTVLQTSSWVAGRRWAAGQVFGARYTRLCPNDGDIKLAGRTVTGHRLGAGVGFRWCRGCAHVGVDLRAGDQRPAELSGEDAEASSGAGKDHFP